MPIAVVLAAGPNGLGVVRSLHLKGIASKVVTLSLTDISLFSRVPLSKHSVQGNSDEEKHKWLLKFLKAEPRGQVVIPTSDWFVTFLSENEEELAGHFSYIIPSQKITDILIDKMQETEYVGKFIPIPKTIQQIESTKQLLNQLGLPIIIKPRSHKHMVLGSKNLIIKTGQELSDFFKKFNDVKTSVIAQQVIPGDDCEQWVCNCCFDRNSEMIQGFTFNRLRLSPPHYGVTSYARSELNETVMEYSRKLGKALNYIGPAMIEFKRDARDGEYKYIELNPRLGMCNYFDTCCGVNNVYCTYLLAAKKPYELTGQMKNDVVFLSLYEDFFSRVRDGESIRLILKSYFRDAAKPHVFIYFVWWDPYPALALGLHQLHQFIKGSVKKLLKRL